MHMIGKIDFLLQLNLVLNKLAYFHLVINQMITSMDLYIKLLHNFLIILNKKKEKFNQPDNI